jgi:hypothetical protein
MPKSVMFVSRYLAESNNGSGEMNLGFIRYLKRIGFDVTFLLLGGSRAVGEELKSLCTMMAGNQDAPYYDSPVTDGERRVIRWAVEKINPQIVVADYSWIAGCLDEVPSTVEKMILVHDLRTRIIADFEKEGFFHCHHPWDERQESECLRKASTIIAIQDKDADECRRMAPEAKIIQINLSAELKFSDESLVVQGRVFYVASGVDENKIAIERFIDNCWPKIRSEATNASLHIAGGVCGRLQIAHDSGISLLGYVPDLDQEYAEAAVCIVPVFHGGGTKLKFIGGLSHGKAMVGNSFAIDGFPTAEQCLCVCDGIAEEFANSVIMLLQMPDIREAARVFAQHIASETLPMEIAYKNLTDHFQSKGFADA